MDGLLHVSQITDDSCHMMGEKWQAHEQTGLTFLGEGDKVREG
jgi:DNA-directed RNA polymerase subunit E'/Rpb7